MPADVSTAALWYLTRGTGLVSLGLLTVVVVLGVVEVQRWSPAGWPRFVLGALHRNASLLAVAFLGVHIASAVVDGFAPISWVSALVPFTSPYRPVWLGLGAVAVDLLIALVVTSLLRTRLSYRTWKAVHWTAYLCWPVALVHGLGTGSDGTTPWVLAVDVVCTGAVVAAVSWRLAGAPAIPAGRRVLAGAGMALVVALVVAWALTGPARPGWARRAGTPPELLAAVPPAAGPAGSGAAADLTGPFSTSFTGILGGQGDPRGTSITATVTGVLAEPAGGALRVVLEGPSSGDGLRLRSGTVTFGPAAAPDRFQGPVSGLDGMTISARVTVGGRDETVTIRLDGSGRPGPVTGTVSATTNGPR